MIKRIVMTKVAVVASMVIAALATGWTLSSANDIRQFMGMAYLILIGAYLSALPSIIKKVFGDVPKN